jgi:hypothetical protein
MKLSRGPGVYSDVGVRRNLLKLKALNSFIPVKTTRILSLATAALCAVLLAGCDTPESRIKDSPQVFARLNPDQQALVKNGQIAVGFDMAPSSWRSATPSGSSCARIPRASTRYGTM